MFSSLNRSEYHYAVHVFQQLPLISSIRTKIQENRESKTLVNVIIYRKFQMGRLIHWKGLHVQGINLSVAQWGQKFLRYPLGYLVHLQ